MQYFLIDFRNYIIIFQKYNKTGRENLENEKLFQCECGGTVIKEDQNYRCKNCNLIVYKKFMGKNLSNDEVKNLFYGNCLELNNIDSSSGKKYNIQVFYNNGEISLEYI